MGERKRIQKGKKMCAPLGKVQKRGLCRSKNFAGQPTRKTSDIKGSIFVLSKRGGWGGESPIDGTQKEAKVMEG